MDIIGDFLADVCVISPDATVPKGELHSTYLRWGKANGEHPVSKIDFSQRLQERGFKEQRVGKDRARCWLGVRLRQPGEADVADVADVKSHIYLNNNLNNKPIIETTSAMSAANGRIYVSLNVESFEEERP